MSLRTEVCVLTSPLDNAHFTVYLLQCYWSKLLITGTLISSLLNDNNYYHYHYMARFVICMCWPMPDFFNCLLECENYSDDNNDEDDDHKDSNNNSNNNLSIYLLFPLRSLHLCRVVKLDQKVLLPCSIRLPARSSLLEVPTLFRQNCKLPFPSNRFLQGLLDPFSSSVSQPSINE